jgi:hypothetical protein
MLVNFCHTGILEVYHNEILKYAPKRLEFDYCQMLARMQLAALDHNSIVNRPQAVVTRKSARSGNVGEPRYRTRFSKATNQWICEPVKVRKSYACMKEIMKKVIHMKELHKPNLMVKPQHIPTNIGKKERISKELLVSSHKSRFK